jgi:hypothetical protein
LRIRSSTLAIVHIVSFTSVSHGNARLSRVALPLSNALDAIQPIIGG